MPHYKDGTEAQVGDIAKGKGYNLPHEVQGVVTRVVPGTGSCDISVMVPMLGYPLTPETLSGQQFATTVNGALAKLADGRLLPVTLGEEHGTCAEFELVHRPVAQANGALK